RTDADEDVQVAGPSAEVARVTLAPDPDALPVMDPGRDLHAQLALLDHASGAVARRTGVLDDLTRAAAAAAALRADELAEDRVRDFLEAPGPTAHRAGAGRRPRLGARAAARRAGDCDPERDLPLDPARGLDQLDLDLGAHVAAARRTARLRADAEQLVAEEEVAERAEVEARRGEAAAAQPGVAEAVVELAALGVGEHFVGLDHLLEALLGVRILRDVRVQLAREPSERLLDLRFARGAFEAE